MEIFKKFKKNSHLTISPWFLNKLKLSYVKKKFGTIIKLQKMAHTHTQTTK